MPKNELIPLQIVSVPTPVDTPSIDESLPQVNLIFDTNASPSHLLHRAQQMAADLHATAFGATGLTQRQLALLAALASDAGTSQADLVTKTGIDRSTLAEMVARMEAKGLVVRSKSQTDSRAKSVTLTALGQNSLAMAIPHLKAIDALVLAQLPSRRRDVLVELLTRIALPQPDAETKKSKSANVAGTEKTKKKKDRKKKKSKK
jgi:MarR family transcriptional regulator, temperature-dependent positive regulator of motility